MGEMTIPFLLRHYAPVVFLVFSLGAAHFTGTRDSGTTPAPASKGEPAYTEVKPDEGLAGYVDRAVRVDGRISPIPWQHLIAPPKGYPEMCYFDFGKGLQTVLYAKKPIACEGTLRIWGIVFELQGESKRPDRKETGVERQIRVDRWECLAQPH